MLLIRTLFPKRVKKKIITEVVGLTMVTATLLCLLFERTKYKITIIDLDKKYFARTYRHRHLDEYNEWDDNLLSPREIAVTEENPPALVMI